MYVTVTGLWYTELIRESKGECTWMIFLVKYENIVRFRDLFKSQWRNFINVSATRLDLCCFFITEL